jgi:hypothetical protein
MSSERSVKDVFGPYKGKMAEEIVMSELFSGPATGKIAGKAAQRDNFWPIPT